MPGEVFISYARKDKDFVQRLHTALAGQGRDAWVDWEDIPLTADWWAEITRGIEAANAFIFVITPDSARSAVCFKEIDHAVQHNKRLIPIVHRELTEAADQQRLHPAVNAHNWIFIREGDDFDAAFAAMIEALDTDLAYLREHTALLVRARTWELRQRDDSLLLRGNALCEAEAWLATGLTKERSKPTDLHIAYIQTSRRAQNRRTQRSRIVSGVVALIVGLAITSLALFIRAEDQRRQADEQRRLAQQSEAAAVFERTRAQAIGISAQAQLELFGLLPERGVLLALAALQRFPYVFEAERALGAAVQTSRARAIFPAAPAAVNAIAWAPDGTRALLVGTGSTAQVWDVAAATPLLTLIGHTQEVVAAAWSPDGTRLATGSLDETARIWDAVTGALLLTITGHDDWVNDVAWSPDGTRLATASADGILRVWEASSAALLLALAGHEGFINAVAWSPDGAWLLTAGQDGTARIWGAQSGVRQTVWAAHEDSVIDVAWSPDGTRALTASWDATARVWDLREALGIGALDVAQQPPAGDLLLTLTGHLSALNSASWSADGRWLLTTSRDRTARVWDATTGATLFVLSGHTAAVNDAAWSPDGTTILTVGADQQARVWDARPGDELLTLTGHTRRLSAAAWSPDGTRIATAAADRTARVWDAQTGALLLTLEGHTRTINAVAWSPDGAQIATASDDRTVRVWEARSGTLLRVFDRHSQPVNALAWSPDGAEIVSVSDNAGLLIWAAESGAVRLTLIGQGGNLSSVDWSPDGAWIVAGSEVGAVAVWEASTGARAVTLEAHTGAVRAVAFSPAAASAALAATRSASPYTPTPAPAAVELRLLTAGDDLTARVWRLVPASATLTPELQLTLAGHTDVITGATWSPNGARIVTASDDRSARLWDAGTGAPLLTVTGHTGGVQGVDWAPDGAAIVTAGADATARTWPIWQTTTALMDFAQQCCVVRELSPEERAQFGVQSE